MTASVDVLASGEGLINPGETEAAVQRGSFEDRAVTEKGITISTHECEVLIRRPVALKTTTFSFKDSRKHFR